MAKTQHVCLNEVVVYFDEPEDPRSDVNQKHPLVSVVVIAMMAVLADAGGPTAIATGAKLKTESMRGGHNKRLPRKSSTVLPPMFWHGKETKKHHIRKSSPISTNRP